ncbi:MAG: MG2 domain-containing protein [Chitinophagales bacterium]|nr:MG2 domain-containing protein [Chitinophagales bacterium]
MKYTYKIALLTLLLFESCKHSKDVKLIATNCTGEVDTRTNLTFTFNKSIIDEKNPEFLAGWIDEEYVAFTPPIKGRFRWENTNTLVFSPESELPPATTFKAVIRPKVCRHSTYKLGKIPVLEFETPRQEVVDYSARWAVIDPSEKKIGIQSQLFFAYEQPFDGFEKNLSIQVNGRKVSYQLAPESDRRSCTILIKDVETKDEPYEISFLVSKGVVPERGKNPTVEDFKNTLKLPSPYELEITYLEAAHDGTEGIINVRTSQKVSASALKNFIQISPEVQFDASPTEDGFQIKSQGFKSTQMYDVKILKGLTGTLGGRLKEDYHSTAAFGEIQPSIAFDDKSANYLSAKGNRNIKIKIVNVPKVKVTVRKIYENNILPALRYGLSNYYDYDYEGSEFNLSDVLYEEELMTATLPGKGDARIFHFNIKDKFPDFKGIYHINVRSAQEYWLSDSRMVALSDIGLIARVSEQQAWVFANSLLSAEPLSNVECVVYGRNNQKIGSGVTDSKGIALISLKKGDATGFTPALITAKTSNDLNYISMQNNIVETSRFEVGGKSISSAGLDAFVYAERNMFRPGDTVFFSAVVRTPEWNKPDDIPLKIKVISPNGQEFKTIRKNLNQQGSFEASFVLPYSALTGTYHLELLTPNEVILADYPILVEEFMPDRIKVTTTLGKSIYNEKDTIILKGKAENLFGTPAAERNYEVEIQYKHQSFSPKNFSEYDFSLSNLKTYFDATTTNGNTRGDGSFEESFSPPSGIAKQGIIKASFFTTVFDETGRPVNRFNQADILTQRVFIGIRRNEWHYYPLNQTIPFHLIAIDINENIVSTPAVIQVIKKKYKNVLVRYGDSYSYESQFEDKVLYSGDLNITGRATTFSYVPREPGNYELRISLPGASSYVSLPFFSYGRWLSSQTDFEVNKEGFVNISTDKKLYKPGDKAKLLFKAPFDGKLLVSIERDKLFESFYLTVQNRLATAEIIIGKDHLPNVYVTATLFKPHAESDFPLTVAHGYANISVVEQSRKIEVKIEAPEKIRSNQKQKIIVRGEPNSFVTLAAVDEGILQITDFKTPDPYEYFYQKRALQVQGFDLYNALFPEIKSQRRSVGGDGFDLGRRTNPLPNKRAKLVRYWSGITQIQSNGLATFEIDVPTFSGKLRLMAVNYKNEKFGAAEAFLTVADPIIISSGIPRFLSPGDEAMVALTVSNTTNTPQRANIAVRTAGPLKATAIENSELTVPPNSEKRTYYTLKAEPNIGEANVRVEVSSGSEKFTEVTDITVRPSASLQKVTGSGEVPAGTSKVISFGGNDFIKGTEAYSLVVSPSPLAMQGKFLTDLLQYPYGCTEQVIAAAFPQIYFADLCNAINLNNEFSKQSFSKNVNEAIRTIKQRQIYSGAVSLWPDDYNEHWWVSAFAAHFLTEARKNGYEVEDAMYNSLLSYLQTRLKKKQTYTYFFNNGASRVVAMKEIPYSLYVLALAGMPQQSAMNYYKENPQLLTNEGKFLIAAAFALAGDKSKIRELLPNNFLSERSDKDVGSNFSSDIRDEALALSVLMDVQPDYNQIPVMVKHVADQLNSHKYLSTQELVFSTLALGKYSRNLNKGKVNAEVKSNGKSLGVIQDNSLKITPKQLKDNKVEISVSSGDGKVYYFWEASGISASGNVKEEDNFLRVRRTFYDRYGNVISSNEFRQNDLIVVGISLESSYSRTIENVVITDMLPAGFEIENPRVKEVPGTNWIKNDSKPIHADIRDDRINLFVNAQGNRQNFYYVVRAVTPGTYKLGTLSADAMYAGEYHSYSGSGQIKILPK